MQTARASSANRPAQAGSLGKGHRSGAFNAAKSLKASKQAARSIVERLRGERDAAAAASKAKRDAKRARRATSTGSGAHLQTVDAAKLKRMTKKQLRSIKRTAVDRDGNVQLVPAYGRSR